MGSNEIAMMVPGALQKLTFLTRTGRHRVQIIYFFRMQVGPRAPSGVGLVVGCRPHRIRHRRGSLVFSEGSGTNCQVIHGFVGRMVAGRPAKHDLRRRGSKRRATGRPSTG